MSCADNLTNDTKRPFNVADDVGLVRLSDTAQALNFSPDGKYFAVVTSRGRLDLNRVEGSVRFYSLADVDRWLKKSGESEMSPLWSINLSTSATGPAIRDWRWLADGSGIAFLQPITENNQQIVLADLRRKKVETLTSAKESVKKFDICDRDHYVYTVGDSATQAEWRARLQAPSIVGTGRSIWELLFPDAPVTGLFIAPRRQLWAVIRGRRFEVKRDRASLALVDSSGLALSPNGELVVTALPVADVPSSWKELYPPPRDNVSPLAQMHTGRQDQSFKANSNWPVREYVLINLQSGTVEDLTGAPLSGDAGWWGDGGSLRWSSDSGAILLPHTFLKSNSPMPSRPCMAVADLVSKTRTCVETMKIQSEGYRLIRSDSFVNRGRQKVSIDFQNEEGLSGTTEYRLTLSGYWELVRNSKEASSGDNQHTKVSIRQGLNNPPLLVVTNNETSRTLWNPNPQLASVELANVSIYNWKDSDGIQHYGGLYKPIGYKAGQPYPLVIQTHGFNAAEFEPSGSFSTAFAAQALAAAGIMVLQIAEHCPLSTLDEGRCAVSAYEAASRQLTTDGLVDPKRIGIIGFSRTGFYVMQTLTMSSLQVRAASITDANTGDYFQYWQGEWLAANYDAIIGAPPFGVAGLQQWLKRSPGFNLEKIAAPLMVTAAGPRGVIFMWQPYAALRYLHKPVDLIMLNTSEHVLTNPAVRMASLSGTVDWFRFWLQDFEDSNPSKAEQYARWRELRKLQDERVN